MAYVNKEPWLDDARNSAARCVSSSSPPEIHLLIGILNAIASGFITHGDPAFIPLALRYGEISKDPDTSQILQNIAEAGLFSNVLINGSRQVKIVGQTR